MNTAELREATKEFDQEFIGDTFGPPTAGTNAHKTAEHVKCVAGPATGWGPKTISVTVEKHLLAQTDRLAKSFTCPAAWLPTDSRRWWAPEVSIGSWGKGEWGKGGEKGTLLISLVSYVRCTAGSVNHSHRGHT